MLQPKLLLILEWLILALAASHHENGLESKRLSPLTETDSIPEPHSLFYFGHDPSQPSVDPLSPPSTNQHGQSVTLTTAAPSTASEKMPHPVGHARHNLATNRASSFTHASRQVVVNGEKLSKHLHKRKQHKGSSNHSVDLMDSTPPSTSHYKAKHLTNENPKAAKLKLGIHLDESKSKLSELANNSNSGHPKESTKRRTKLSRPRYSHRNRNDRPHLSNKITNSEKAKKQTIKTPSKSKNARKPSPKHQVGQTRHSGPLVLPRMQTKSLRIKTSERPGTSSQSPRATKPSSPTKKRKETSHPRVHKEKVSSRRHTLRKSNVASLQPKRGNVGKSSNKVAKSSDNKKLRRPPRREKLPPGTVDADIENSTHKHEYKTKAVDMRRSRKPPPKKPRTKSPPNQPLSPTEPLVKITTPLSSPLSSESKVRKRLSVRTRQSGYRHVLNHKRPRNKTASVQSHHKVKPNERHSPKSDISSDKGKQRFEEVSKYHHFTHHGTKKERRENGNQNNGTKTEKRTPRITNRKASTSHQPTRSVEIYHNAGNKESRSKRSNLFVDHNFAIQDLEHDFTPTGELKVVERKPTKNKLVSYNNDLDSAMETVPLTNEKFEAALENEDNTFFDERAVQRNLHKRAIEAGFDRVSFIDEEKQGRKVPVPISEVFLGKDKVKGKHFKLKTVPSKNEDLVSQFNPRSANRAFLFPYYLDVNGAFKPVVKMTLTLHIVDIINSAPGDGVSGRKTAKCFGTECDAGGNLPALGRLHNVDIIHSAPEDGVSGRKTAKCFGTECDAGGDQPALGRRTLLRVKDKENGNKEVVDNSPPEEDVGVMPCEENDRDLERKRRGNAKSFGTSILQILGFEFVMALIFYVCYIILASVRGIPLMRPIIIGNAGLCLFILCLLAKAFYDRKQLASNCFPK